MEVSVRCGKASKLRRYQIGLLTVTCVALTLLVLLGAAPARADTFEVNDPADPGDGTCAGSECTLRQAIAEANANDEADTITFASGLDDHITLNDGVLTVQNDGPGQDLTIDGPGVGQLSVDGDGQSAVFAIGTGSEVSIEGLTITGGEADNGGGISVNEGGTLTVTDSSISDNSATESGGGILNEGTLTINQSTISGNSAANNGGGIFNYEGTLTVNQSTVSGNSAEAASGSGGGIDSYAAEAGGLTVNGSTISGNEAGSDSGSGGGLVSFTDIGAGTAQKTTITNSTISGNSAGSGADSGGGGVFNELGLTVIENTTITDNSAPAGAGGGVANAANSATPASIRTEVGSSIVAGNEQPNGSSGTDVDYETLGNTVNTFDSDGYNIIGDGDATDAFTGPGDETNVSDPGLGPLADNDGPTETHALQTSSPALDNVAKSACPPPDTDQRGVSRPQGASCDSGSYEKEAETTPEPKCTIRGTSSGENIQGTAGRDVICGYGGKDKIYALGGDDLVRGGAGNDTLDGGSGKDTVRGEVGKDTVRGGTGGDTLYGGSQNDTLIGGPGKDRFFGGGGRDVRRP